MRYLLLLLFALPAWGQFPVTLLDPGFVAGRNVASADGIPANLVGWWKLNDGSGTTAADSSGNSNDGTVANATWGTGPNSNGDLVFDGAGDTVTIANETNFDFETNNTFSVTCWIKVNASAAGVDIIWTKNVASGNFQGYVIEADADNARIKAFILDSAGGVLNCETATSTVTAGTWYFLVMTYDGSSAGSGLSLYLDAGTPATGAGTLAATILNDASPYIGYGNGLGGDFFGELDDVRVYDVELTSGEISTLNSGGAQ